LITNGKAKASSDFDTFSWMVSSLSTLASLFNTCLEVPEDISFNSATTPLHISNAGNWVATGVQVTGGKLLEFDWSFTGITAFPRKYLVLYRIDPRFATPQIFIQTYDYAQQKYISDFGQFQNGQLLIYQKNPSIDWNERILSYTNYFNFVGRSGISVQAGDVVNITLISSASFFALGDFNSELSSPGSELSLIYTVSPIDDNKLIYFSADAWCNDTGTHNQKNPYCSNGFYANPSNIALELNGGINDIRFNQVLPSINSCPDSGDIDASILCFFDKGRGMEISIGDQVIKDTNVSFVHSNFLDKDLLYYESSSSGTLNISTNWEISGMFPNVNQQMISWLQYQSLDQLTSNLTSDNSNSDMQFLHFGRYILEIEIGNNDKPSGIGIEYTISASQPDSDFTGVNVSQNFKIDAPQDGYLWLRVTNNVTPQDAISQGTINVNYTNYIGSGVFTNIVYNKLVGPLRSQFNTLTQIIYEKLANNATLQRIAQLLLILYITIYGLLFLAGATKITVDDIVIRVIKISIITALFSEQSWNFFNNNLFEIYISGTDYIMTSIVNTTSSATNVFGFIDPVFDKYTNTRIWGLLLIQLLQLQNGLTFLAIMTAYSILLFFKAVLEVIVGYCLAFVGLAVMISLAPFFIVLMLFEQTKSIFDNWLSTLFSYMIQPTILLVFFLLIDQMIDTQLAGAVSKACWSCVIPLKIGLDLRHIGI
ncbi:MAG: type IV secretion system protein, partial [Janthinobacterium lividum]